MKCHDRSSMVTTAARLRVARRSSWQKSGLQTKRILIKRKISICVKHVLWYTSVRNGTRIVSTPVVGMNCRILLLLLLISNLLAQDRNVDATWLHRVFPGPREKKNDLSLGNLPLRAIFGAGDADNRILRSVSRFAEISV